MTEPTRGYYPGSKEPLPPLEDSALKAPEPEVWDVRPVTKVVAGVNKEFFTIGAVAVALNRSPVTIRLWIRQGHLPQATYRLPTKNDVKGRRLYTRAQIESLITVAKQHGLGAGQRVQWEKHPTFAYDVREAWKQNAT